MLSGKPRRSGTPTVWTPADEAPWSRKRMAYQPPDGDRPMRSSVAYAELHAHSAYSFLDGASAPEELVEEAVRLGL
ncbi:MAG: error-prone polymerase, partial [Mycobacterium sp.]|nr:error-prone polymerase [Mycobacterium sp.]